VEVGTLQAKNDARKATLILMVFKSTRGRAGHAIVYSPRERPQRRMRRCLTEETRRRSGRWLKFHITFELAHTHQRVPLCTLFI
jgi:hypothetical protein